MALLAYMHDEISNCILAVMSSLRGERHQKGGSFSDLPRSGYERSHVLGLGLDYVSDADY